MNPIKKTEAIAPLKKNMGEDLKKKIKKHFNKCMEDMNLPLRYAEAVALTGATAIHTPTGDVSIDSSIAELGSRAKAFNSSLKALMKRLIMSLKI